MAMCFKCVTPIEKENEPESFLKCSICAENYHPNCGGTTKKFLKTIVPFKNFSWTCDDCLDRRDALVSINKRLADIEKVLKVLESGQKSQGVEISALKSVNKNGYPKIYSETPSSAKRKWSEVVEECDSDEQTPRSSTKRSNRPKKPKTTVTDATYTRRRDPVLIVKAKNDPDKKKSKQLVSKLLHPKNDPVNRLQETASGDVIVFCNDEKSLDVVKNKITGGIGDDFVVDQPKELQPRLKIVGIDPDYCEQGVFYDALKSQNEDIFTEASTIELIQDPKQRTNNKVTAIIGVDMATFKRAMDKERIKIGWSICRVYEQIDVLRCFRCSAFTHTSKQCDADKPACAICGGDHMLESCGVKERKDFKCINCCRRNERYKTKANVNHSAMSIECPVLKKKIEQKRNTIRYRT